MSELLKDQVLYTKEYYEKKPITPDEETLTQQLNLTPLEPETTPGVDEEAETVPGRFLANDVLDGKIVGLYFSALWCPPCQQFTPLLRDVYDELQRRGSNFEVIFLSFDKTDEEMEKYFREKHGDWHAVPFGEPLIEELKEKFDVTCIPRLIVVNKAGEVITGKGRKEIQDKGMICFRNWQQTDAVLDARATTQTTDETPETKEGDNKNNNSDNKLDNDKDKNT